MATTCFILVCFPSIPSGGGGLGQNVLVRFGEAASVQVYLLLEKAGSKGTLKWKGLGLMVNSEFLGELIPQTSWWEMLSPALAGEHVLCF